jgi:hypothetical protein
VILKPDPPAAPPPQAVAEQDASTHQLKLVADSGRLKSSEEARPKFPETRRLARRIGPTG